MKRSFYQPGKRVRVVNGNQKHLVGKSLTAQQIFDTGLFAREPTSYYGNYQGKKALCWLDKFGANEWFVGYYE